MLKKYSFLILLFLLIVIFIISYFLYFLFSVPKHKTVNNIQHNKINKTLNTKKEKKEKKIYPSKIYHVNGTVKKVSNNKIFVEAIPYIINKKNNQKNDTRIVEVIIKDTTKITKLNFVANENKKSYSPVIKNISKEEIKVGDSIEAIAGNDIKGLDKFTATSIQILPKSIR